MARVLILDDFKNLLLCLNSYFTFYFPLIYFYDVLVCYICVVLHSIALQSSRSFFSNY